MRLARFLALGIALSLAFGFVTAAEEDKDVKADILKLADALQKNDTATVKKLVDQLKKQDLEDIMSTMKPPSKKGFDVVKEGVEIKLNSLSKRASDVNANAAAYEKMGKIVAAIAEVTAVKCPVDKKQGDKDPKKWAEWTKDLKDGAKSLTSAAKAKDAKGVSTAAKKVTSACNDCHGVFRD
jgi:hypothetical protein